MQIFVPDAYLTTFFASSMLLALAPGPDNLFVLSQSAAQGRCAGLWITLGLCTGLVVHTTLVGLGVAVLFQSAPAVFGVLKLAGTAYLAYLAWQAFRAGQAGSSVTAVAPTAFQLYRRGIIMNVTNPKVSLFFLAFLPQFIRPEAGPAGDQVALLGGLFILATLLVFGSIALLAGSVQVLVRTRPGVQRGLNIVAGLVLAGLAIRLAVA